MRFFFALILGITILSCNNNDGERSGIEIIKIDHHRVDSIQKNSDTAYTRSVGAAEFNTAEQYIDNANSIVSKIMKDTSGHITALVQFHKDTRITYEEYYPNGQLKAKLPLNAQGQFHGDTRYYYENGRIKSTGRYAGGFFTGTWKNYDESGKLVSREEYDRNGQLIRTN